MADSHDVYVTGHGFVRQVGSSWSKEQSSKGERERKVDMALIYTQVNEGTR
jgi:hypothetical protein